MTTQYGMLNTAFFTAWVQAWGTSEYGPAPTVEALAIALAMPSVERSGQTGTRAGLKAPGLGSFYLACAFNWVHGVEHGCVDRAYTVATGSPSNKQNNMTGLVAAGLIERYRVGNTYQVALTDAGLAQVKLINGDLAKAAKGYTVAARDKAFTAFSKAAKAAAKVEKPVKAKPRKAKVVEVTDTEVATIIEYGPTPVEGYTDHTRAE